jgi:VIT1/CCC1 family predicted Fe2+/Mn2+ transporter
VLRGVLRMLLWGALAMGLTALVGRLVGAVV